MGKTAWGLASSGRTLLECKFLIEAKHTHLDRKKLQRSPIRSKYTIVSKYPQLDRKLFSPPFAVGLGSMPEEEESKAAPEPEAAPEEPEPTKVACATPTGKLPRSSDDLSGSQMELLASWSPLGARQSPLRALKIAAKTPQHSHV